MDLVKQILSDPINKWIFSHIKKDIFLVGGYIRDLLHNGHINKDKDYVLKDNIKEVALLISNKFKGSFIELRKDQTCRVVLKNGCFLDFSRMQNTILEDLAKRDFRINAIAWSPERGIIDPFFGKNDLTKKIIRIINSENIVADPLRILRAYRLAAQLGFTIDIDTRKYLRKYSSHIKEIASERITEELFKLLMADTSSSYISLIEKDKVLHKILTVSAPKINQNMLMLGNFDRFILSIRKSNLTHLFNTNISTVLNRNISQGLSIEGLIRLSILLNDPNRTKKNKYGKLKFSKSITNKLRNIQNAIILNKGRITEGKLYDIFIKADDCAFEVALLISVTNQKNVDKFLKRADNFIKFKKQPLLDGYKIQKILNIDPSSLIGNIQAEIQRRRFLGITRTKNEALRWIVSNFT